MFLVMSLCYKLRAIPSRNRICGDDGNEEGGDKVDTDDAPDMDEDDEEELGSRPPSVILFLSLGISVAAVVVVDMPAGHSNTSSSSSSSMIFISTVSPAFRSSTSVLLRFEHFS